MLNDLLLRQGRNGGLHANSMAVKRCSVIVYPSPQEHPHSAAEAWVPKKNKKKEFTYNLDAL